MVAFCDIRRGVYGFAYLLHGYREPLSDLWLTTNALSTVFNGLEIIGKSNIVFLTLIKFLDRNTYFLIDSQRRFDRLAGSTNAYIKNTRSLGVEVAGTANHFRATLATIRYFPPFTRHHSKGLKSLLFFVTIRYAWTSCFMQAFLFTFWSLLTEVDTVVCFVI